MHPSPSDASPALPAFVLALALLGVLAAVGGQVVGQMRMAPGTLLAAGAEAAVASPNNARAPAAYGASAVPQVETGPGWETLNTPQKLALYPLAERWALISEAQKRRWLALAANFPALPEDEQAKFHERMTDWASLSAQQRNQARLNYAATNRLAPDDKRAQWEAYQALSEDERRALAARAAPKPKGAAVALRPVSSRKLAQVPAATQATPWLRSDSASSTTLSAVTSSTVRRSGIHTRCSPQPMLRPPRPTASHIRPKPSSRAMPSRRTAAASSGSASAAAPGSSHSARPSSTQAPNTKPSVLISTTWPISARLRPARP